MNLILLIPLTIAAISMVISIAVGTAWMANEREHPMPTFVVWSTISVLCFLQVITLTLLGY